MLLVCLPPRSSSPLNFLRCNPTSALHLHDANLYHYVFSSFCQTPSVMQICIRLCSSLSVALDRPIMTTATSKYIALVLLVLALLLLSSASAGDDNNHDRRRHSRSRSHTATDTEATDTETTDTESAAEGDEQPPATLWRNWGQTQTSAYLSYTNVTSEQQIVDIVQQANAEGTKVSVVGSSHSFGKVVVIDVPEVGTA